jgi:AraC-like DNA-binding protein
MFHHYAQLLEETQIQYATGWLSSMHAGHHCPMHKHSTVEIVYHASVHGISEIDKATPIDFQQGSVTIYPAHLWHDQLSEVEGEDYCIHIQADHPATKPMQQPIHIPFLADAYTQRELRDLATLTTPVAQMEIICANHRAHAVFTRLIHIAMNKDQSQIAISNAEKYAEQAYEYISRQFRKIKTLDDVAQHVGVSQDYLRHIFQQQYDVRMTDHLTTSRIEHAKGLLVYSTLSAKAVGIQCGFKTARHFSSLFQKHVGMSPITFRKSRQSPNPQ